MWLQVLTIPWESLRTFISTLWTLTIGETQTKFYYKIGQSVIVKNGVPDPDYDTEIGGWKGTIYNIENADDPLIDIEWDYETQEKIPKSQIKACEKNDLDYTKIRLFASDVEPDSFSEKKDDNKIILKTMTQEIYMLARINTVRHTYCCNILI